MFSDLFTFLCVWQDFSNEVKHSVWNLIFSFETKTKYDYITFKTQRVTWDQSHNNKRRLLIGNVLNSLQGHVIQMPFLTKL